MAKQAHVWCQQRQDVTAPANLLQQGSRASTLGWVSMRQRPALRLSSDDTAQRSHMLPALPVLIAVAGVAGGRINGARRAWQRPSCRRRQAVSSGRRDVAGSPASRGADACSAECLALAVRKGPMQTPVDALDHLGQMDPYKVLQVPFMSNDSRVHSSYLRLVREEHPDLHGGRESMRWIMGERAYRILSDPEERAKYITVRFAGAALKLTVGVATFGFAAAGEIGNILANAVDAWNVASKKLLASRTRLISESISPDSDGLQDSLARAREGAMMP